jgi:hypothetical protein
VLLWKIGDVAGNEQMAVPNVTVGVDNMNTVETGIDKRAQNNLHALVIDAVDERSTDVVCIQEFR